MTEEMQAPAAGPLGRALSAACRLFALIGGAVLSALVLMSVASIVGRMTGRPIQGDFELVQFGCAVAIAFFLPYCQFSQGNIIVDFFTLRASQRTRSALDALGAMLLAAVMALVAWRTGAGAVEMKAGGETSMLMGVPLWYAYALMTPAFALTALAGLHTAWRTWKAE
jgi:TRAP-type C4-dicarboxylate transport system permease small subunit